jgi:hypothetical protein
MPGFDGTGPSGMGPFTGGGRGFCAMPVNSIRGNFTAYTGRQNYDEYFAFPGLQAGNNFVNPYLSQYPYQLRSIGYAGRTGGYFKGRGSRGIRGRGRRY